MPLRWRPVGGPELDLGRRACQLSKMKAGTREQLNVRSDEAYERAHRLATSGTSTPPEQHSIALGAAKATRHA